MPGLHSFHIPVLGVGYSVDTPVKVARFGISSVISVMDDELLEQLRRFYCEKTGIPFIPIGKEETDGRAQRITAYLNLVQDMVDGQVAALKQLPFAEDNELDKYFRMLPDDAPLKIKYNSVLMMAAGPERAALEKELRNSVIPGEIDVNIMVKVDKINHDKTGAPLPSEYSDALSAFRGFANSKLSSSVVLSAGYNPRLYSYIEQFDDFLPDASGRLKKKIIIKVSDYRSALVQGKILAKKGIWVSEFRIESGLNCGGHAFATEGVLLGPILQEFKSNRSSLVNELYSLCTDAHQRRGIPSFTGVPPMKITVQGGIGTAEEQRFLLEHYEVSATGWGSPFLLVPDATNVDEETLQQLATAKQDDYYLSDASPLGVPFNNFRRSSSAKQIMARVQKGRPGSPCYKKFLVSDTEFTGEPICTASRQYQHLKIQQLKEQNLPAEIFETEYNKIIAKDCLCEGLTAPALLKDDLPIPHRLSAVTICPGPNLAYFSGVFSLPDMIDHIYGRKNLLNALPRPHMFVNELNLYIDYLKKAISDFKPDAKRSKYLANFKNNLLEGVEYYRKLAGDFAISIQNDLSRAGKELTAIPVPTV